jgi:hypothetical protein
MDQLARSTRNLADSQKLLALSLDISAGTGQDLLSVSTALGQAYNGNFSLLQRLKTGLSDATIQSGDFGKATTELAGIFQGQAEKQAATFTGGINKLKVALKDTNQTLGTILMPAFQFMINLINEQIVPALNKFVKKLQDNPKAMKDVIAGLATLVKWAIIGTQFVLILADAFVLLGIGVASLPYALPVFSIDNHFAYIQLLATQTLSSGLMQSNIAYAAFSIFPVIWLWSSQRNHPEFRQLGMIILVDVFIELLVCIAASKPGAGPHHLLPGLPIKIWLVHQLTYKNKDFNARAYRFLGLVFFVMSIYFISYGYPKFLRVHLVSLDSYWRQVEAKQELIELVKKYPRPLIGVSGDKHENYSLSFYRPYAFGPTYRNNLDPVAFMEVNYTLKVDDALFIQQIKNCSYPSILLPAIGEPYSMTNFYTNKPLFTDGLRSNFYASYKKSLAGKFYDVYTCSIK